jgi:hypothetical protein
MSAEQLVAFEIQRLFQLGLHQAGSLRNCSIITVNLIQWFNCKTTG